ncbi:hypothetical protein B0H15DRAFT_927522 [Mycena belliarum]|uniref:Uncharacterized protein n=1 Tax=Mycena belliarum TaxID=1033014 RepID=A0AAD6XY59_9AGAR|nr:hypothetical protein B0H15DRAFT_927522 [Mycena belliae]
MSATQWSAPHPLLEHSTYTEHGSQLAPASEPVFPADIERFINEILVDGWPEMCGTMSLVAARFQSWTKPFRFRTVIVRRSNNWTQRINSWLLPNADFIRTLVLDLPLKQAGYRSEVPAAELAILRALLEAAGGVRHLAVTWSIWDHLQLECGALQLRSLYLVWDEVYNISAPSLECLQHPDALVDLTFYAPEGLRFPDPWRGESLYRLPATSLFDSLDYVTYAADSIPNPGIRLLRLKGAMLVLTGRDWGDLDEYETKYIEDDRARYPHFSAVCVQHRNQILDEWVARMQGRESRLDHTVQKVVSDGE